MLWAQVFLVSVAGPSGKKVVCATGYLGHRTWNDAQSRDATAAGKAPSISESSSSRLASWSLQRDISTYRWGCFCKLGVHFLGVLPYNDL